MIATTISSSISENPLCFRMSTPCAHPTELAAAICFPIPRVECEPQPILLSHTGACI
jgi:hypothetical protein